LVPWVPLTKFDAFQSIFPAGTVTQAPKIKAIIIGKRATWSLRGAGRFRFADDACIDIRTMAFKDGTAFLQAGGIVFDSLEEEYIETMNN
jgi:anthranilate synthase component I